MIQVTHGSSRMSPCFAQVPFPDGTGPFCEEAGAPCRWVTDAFGYTETAPLFDYASNGRFKTGDIAVSVYSVGTLVEVIDRDTGENEGYWAGEAFYVANQQVVRAVAYR